MENWPFPANQINQLFLANHDISRHKKNFDRYWRISANQINHIFLAAQDISRQKENSDGHWPTPINQINQLFLAAHDISRHKRIRMEIDRYQPIRIINYFLQSTRYHVKKKNSDGFRQTPANPINQLFFAARNISRHKKINHATQKIRMDIDRYQPIIIIT